MNIKFRGIAGRYVNVTLTIDNGTFDLGTLDKDEAKELAQTLQEAADELRVYGGDE